MNVASIGAAVNLLTATLTAAQQISSLITEAATGGRTTLTDAEWASITQAADKAHQALEAALAGGTTGTRPADSTSSAGGPASQLQQG